MARKGVAACDDKNLRFVHCILDIGFRIAEDLPLGTILRA